MTRDELLKMASKAGLAVVHFSSTPEAIERFAALVAAAEREACAQIGDGYDYGDRNCGDLTQI